jgi:hypothetical protein
VGMSHYPLRVSANNTKLYKGDNGKKVSGTLVSSEGD